MSTKMKETKPMDLFLRDFIASLKCSGECKNNIFSVAGCKR